LIDDRASGRLVPTGNRVELAAVTRELLSEPALAGRFGAAGKARTAERHSVSDMTDRYALLYEQLLGG
jgi:glycosyltransferase involved in cell wall biosynthesis